MHRGRRLRATRDAPRAVNEASDLVYRADIPLQTIRADLFALLGKLVGSKFDQGFLMTA